MRPEPPSCVPLPGEGLSVLLPRPGSDVAWGLGKRCANRLSAFLLLGAGWVGAGGPSSVCLCSQGAVCTAQRSGSGLGCGLRVLQWAVLAATGSGQPGREGP